MTPSHKQVREPVEDRNIGARAVGEVHISDSSQLGATWIDHDQPGALADQPLEARTDDRMGLGWIGADKQDAVGLVESHRRSSYRPTGRMRRRGRLLRVRGRAGSSCRHCWCR